MLRFCSAWILPVLYRVALRRVAVPFEWRRLATVLGLAAATYAIGVVATSESGAASLLLRGILIPLYLIALWPAGFFVRGELRGWRGFFARVRLAHP